MHLPSRTEAWILLDNLVSNSIAGKAIALRVELLFPPDGQTQDGQSKATKTAAGWRRGTEAVAYDLSRRLSDSLAPENILHGSGRGTFLIRAQMDVVPPSSRHLEAGTSSVAIRLRINGGWSPHLR